MEPKAPRWYERLAAWCKKHGRHRTIMDHLDERRPYLERHYLPPFQGREHSLLAVCLHKILISDGDDLHDHPGPYLSVILAGSYIEHTPKGAFLRRPGSIRFRSGRSFHRLELVNGPVWTLFVFGPRYRNWGFLTPRGWVDHETHLAKQWARLRLYGELP